jgi:hypothetical protein
MLAAWIACTPVCVLVAVRMVALSVCDYLSRNKCARLSYHGKPGRNVKNAAHAYACGRLASPTQLQDF